MLSDLLMVIVRVTVTVTVLVKVIAMVTVALMYDGAADRHHDSGGRRDYYDRDLS